MLEFSLRGRPPGGRRADQDLRARVGGVDHGIPARTVRGRGAARPGCRPCRSRRPAGAASRRGWARSRARSGPHGPRSASATAAANSPKSSGSGRSGARRAPPAASHSGPGPVIVSSGSIPLLLRPGRPRDRAAPTPYWAARWNSVRPRPQRVGCAPAGSLKSDDSLTAVSASATSREQDPGRR